MTNTSVQLHVDLQTPQRLDTCLAYHLSWFSRSRWQRMIKERGVHINGRLIHTPSCKVCLDDTITVELHTRQEPEVDTGYSILYDDEHILAVSKSGDMPVHPAGIYHENTLTELLKRDLQYPLYLINRLDRETSGIVLFAKDSLTASRISTSWADVHKEYRLLVYGAFPDRCVCTVPIGPAHPPDEKRTDVVRKKRLAYDGAPECAETLYRCISRGNGFSLIAAQPKTGRQHQIRVHCRYLGYPVVGDKIYGIDERCYLEFINGGITESLLRKTLMPRCALHSAELQCEHPETGEWLTIQSPVPQDMHRFMKEHGISDRT